jgi:type I restriction enzyme, S subunit
VSQASVRVAALGQVLKLRTEFIDIDDARLYKRCRVQLRGKGIVLRDSVVGSAIKTKRQQVCRAGDFLVAEIDAKVGGFGIVPPELDGAIVSGHYFLFEVDQDRLDRSFLGYYIQTRTFSDQVTAQGSTNYAAIRPQQVLQYRMPLPPLDVQRRAVHLMQEAAGLLDEVDELRTTALAAGEAMVHSIAVYLLKSATDCKETTVEDVCTAIIDNLHRNPIYAEEGVPCVRSPDVGWGVLNLESSFKTSEAEYQNRTVRGEPSPGDVVLVREGGGTGKAAIVRNGQRFSLGQRVMMLRPNPKIVLPDFFLQQLLSPLIQEEQLRPRILGSASPHLNIAAVRRFRFLLPPLGEQSRIVERFAQLREQLAKLRADQVQTGTEMAILRRAAVSAALTPPMPIATRVPVS